MKESTEQLIADLSYRIRIVRNLYAKETKESSEEDLTEHERMILELISRNGSLKISSIADFFPTSPSAISTTIKKLEKEKDLVLREQAPKDERVKNVSLSDHGKEVLERIFARQIMLFSMITVALGLSPDEIKVVQKAINNAIGYFDNLIAQKQKPEPDMNS